MIWVKTVIFTILVPGTVTLVLPFFLLQIDHHPPPDQTLTSFMIGLALMGLGLIVYLLCAWDFAAAGRGTPAPLEPPKKLVVESLYRVSRNPMYLGIVSILIGESVFFQSLVLSGYTVAVFICFHLFVRLYEEPTLEKQFGEEYIRYSRKVPRWLIWGSQRDFKTGKNNSCI